VAHRTVVTTALLAVVTLLAGCGGGDDGPESGVGAEGPVVVVTTSILGDIAGDVLAGTDARVDVLMPPGADPHVWLDPVRAAGIAEEIAAGYAAVDPTAAEAARAGADEYAQRMVELDEELDAMLAPLPDERRRLVTNHDALGYLAARYDLEVVATVLPGTSADVDVTAEAFTGLVELLRETGIPAVFAETTSTDRLARALAEEVAGVEVVELYTGSLGAPGSGADTLAGMLRTDVERIVAALG
jgi:zinc/manganese transport system substrate-binding protein